MDIVYVCNTVKNINQKLKIKKLPNSSVGLIFQTNGIDRWKITFLGRIILDDSFNFSGLNDLKTEICNRFSEIEEESSQFAFAIDELIKESLV